MKFLNILIAFCIIYTILLAGHAKADEVPNIAGAGATPEEAIQNQFGVNIANIPQTPEDAKNMYLKKEWRKIIESKPYIGPVFKIFNIVMNALNPVFTKVLGVNYSLSWAFVFAVMLWIILFVLLRPVISQLFKNYWFGFIATAVIVSLIGLSGAIKKATDTLVIVVTNIWLAGLAFLLAVVLMILFSGFGKNIARKIKQSEEEAKKAQTEKDRQIIHADAKIIKKEFED